MDLVRYGSTQSGPKLAEQQSNDLVWQIFEQFSIAPNEMTVSREVRNLFRKLQAQPQHQLTSYFTRS